MNTLARSMLKGLMAVVSKLLFVAGGLLLLFGGRAIHEFANIERVLAEMEGLGLAVLCIGLGITVNVLAGKLDSVVRIDDSSSSTESPE